MDAIGNRTGNAVPLFVYMTSHAHSRTVCSAFAEGSGGITVAPDELRDGHVAMYGRLRGCQRILDRAIREDRRFYYIDRGYFGASHDADYSGHFLVAVDHLQHSGRGAPDYDRMAKQKLHFRQTRSAGKHILVCPPPRIFAELSGFSSEAWTKQIIADIKLHTGRPIRIREKPKHPHTNVPLALDLQDAWCLVTHSSKAAIDAILYGVPVICTAACAALAMGSSDVSTVDAPRAPDIDERREWAGVLAANQWTLDEMRSGRCWSDLQR